MGDEIPLFYLLVGDCVPLGSHYRISRTSWTEGGPGLANFNHVPGGSNVMWMDGHVSFEKFPGIFPVNRIWVHSAYSMGDAFDSPDN